MKKIFIFALCLVLLSCSQNIDDMGENMFFYEENKKNELNESLNLVSGELLLSPYEFKKIDINLDVLISKNNSHVLNPYSFLYAQEAAELKVFSGEDEYIFGLPKGYFYEIRFGDDIWKGEKDNRSDFYLKIPYGLNRPYNAEVSKIISCKKNGVTTSKINYIEIKSCSSVILNGGCLQLNKIVDVERFYKNL